MPIHEDSLPLIGITMGDPAGIGPEIILKALADKEIFAFCRPVVLGDAGILSSFIGRAPGEMEIQSLSSPSMGRGMPGTIDVVALSHLRKDSVLPGRPNLEGGKAMMTYILEAVEMARRGEIQAMVTCPISKALMHRSGYAYEGHTHLIAHLTGTRDFVMMLAGERLRVVLVTVHCGLEDVCRLLDPEKVYRTIRVTARALEVDFGIKAPLLAVAALNPHAGEGGLFGSEEREIILPAVVRAREEGFRVEGPLPADTLFWKAANGRFDAVVAMYHDQGLIPLKLLHFVDAVNITLGLPIVRTSVDHGTAYDIAGTGKADPSSLKAAIMTASRIATNRRRKN